MIVPLQMALPLGVQGRAIGVFTLVVTGVAGSLGPLLTGGITQGSGLPLGITILLLGLGGAFGAGLLIRRAISNLDRARNVGVWGKSVLVGVNRGCRWII